MMKIEIICGTYGYRPDGSKHPIPIDRGGICEVSEEEAQRLFALCVARPAEETPSPAVATPPTGEDGSGAGADPSNSDEGAEDAESAHLDPEQLKTLTNAKLAELAKEMGIDTAKLKTKAQLIAAITDVPLEDAIACGMSGFKDMVARDNFGVFLNCDEFAEKRTVKYDGATYEDIPIVLSGLKEKDRRQLMSDHAQGLYIVSSVLHCALSDLGGVQPERGQRIRINDQEGGGGFFREFYVASSVCEMGMLRVELEAVDE